MNTIITSFVKKISEYNPEFSNLELKKMEYGLTCFFDEITKFIPYFIIFWIFSLQEYYAIALLFFCPIRLFSGGYHAKTYWGCFFISFIVFFMIIICGKYLIINNDTIIISLLIISFMLILIFSPVDNINKPIKSKQRRLKLKYYSIFITLFLIITCYFIPNKFLTTAAISIISATIMMLIGLIFSFKLTAL